MQSLILSAATRPAAPPNALTQIGGGCYFLACFSCPKIPVPPPLLLLLTSRSLYLHMGFGVPSVVPVEIRDERESRYIHACVWFLVVINSLSTRHHPGLILPMGKTKILGSFSRSHHVCWLRIVCTTEDTDERNPLLWSYTHLYELLNTFSDKQFRRSSRWLTNGLVTPFSFQCLISLDMTYEYRRLLDFSWKFLVFRSEVVW